VQPRSLTNLQQGPDGTFYDAQGLPLHPDLQQSLHASELFHHQQQQQQQYAQLSAPPQQPPLPQQFAPLPPHALHFEQQFAPPPQYAPQTYQQIQQVHHPQHHAHATSPPFRLTPGPVPGPAHQIHTPHAHTPIHTTPRIAQRPLQIAQQTPVQHSPQQQQYSSPLESVAGPSDETTLANHGQFKGLKLIPNPPNLEEWRQRLFDVDDIITLTEEQFQTYFPHIDNVYSHRSTQRHKRKSFVSHYWDCRLKGRPPGTKKSTDPDKKKRKRVARERDLCDVKIKITEFFDQKEYEEQMGHPLPTTEEDDPMSMGSTQAGPSTATPDQSMFYSQQMTPQQTMTPWGIQSNIVQPGMSMFAPPPPPLPGPPPKKFYTFQRVNGNGGNGKGDGVAGPHKHTLEESDRVKKNIVMRTLAKSEKDVKKVQVSLPQSALRLVFCACPPLFLSRAQFVCTKMSYDIILMVVAWMIYRGVQQLHFVYQPPCVFTTLHVFTSQSIAISISSFYQIVASSKFSCITSILSCIFLLHCTSES
jgi:glutathione S-transferase